MVAHRAGLFAIRIVVNTTMVTCPSAVESLLPSISTKLIEWVLPVESVATRRHGGKEERRRQ